MLLVSNHLTVVVGLDVHFVTMPPYFPYHPYIGIVMDPGDYLPYIGSTVNINGIPRGVSDTSGIIIPLVHIPMPNPPWLMAPIIGHESTNFYASENVYADGSRLSPKGFITMTCNDIGVPLSLQAGKKKFWKVVPTLFAPTAITLPISTGAPVNVGGPYVPDWGGMIKNMIMGLGFSGILKYGKTLFNRFLKNAKGPKWLSRALCYAGFEPVNFINGAVVYDGIDFSLPGAIPFQWKRSWYSDSSYEGLLGYGCHWQYEREIQYYPEENCWGLRMADGRVVSFPLLEVSESYYLRQEKVNITFLGDSFEVFDYNDHLTYEFTAWHHQYYKLTRIEQTKVCGIDFHYQNKQLQYIVDSAGRKIIPTLDGKGRITSVKVFSKGADYHKISYEYDSDGNMIRITDALDQSTLIDYQEHRMIRKQDRNGQCFYWEYDTLGRCVHTWGDGGWQKGHLSYFPEKGYNKITDSLGNTTIYYYDENQLVHRIENPLGASKHFEYTPYMELYREVNEDGDILGYTYDDKGFLTSKVYPNGTEQLYVYDSLSRLKVSVAPDSSQTIYAYYDDTHQVRAVIPPDGRTLLYTYTPEGLPLTITQEEKELQLVYDTQCNLAILQSNELQTEWRYDPLGQLLAKVDVAGRTEYYKYDDLGRVITHTRTDSTREEFTYNAYEEVTEVSLNSRTQATFEYTPLGSLKKRKQGSTQELFSYDAMEQLVSVTNAHQETFTFTRDKTGAIISQKSFDGITKHFLRSQAGKVLQIEGAGEHTSFEYNRNGQISYIDYGDGTWESYNYDKMGRLTQARNPNSVITLVRDQYGRIIEEQQAQPFGRAHSHNISSVYNAEGQRIQIKAQGIAIEQQYNAFGQLSAIEAVHDKGYWNAQIERNLYGEATGFLFGNKVSQEITYDSLGRTKAHLVKDGYGRECYKRDYIWNRVSNLEQMINHTDLQGILYEYDELHQLVSAHGSIKTERKCPDAIGNLYTTETQTDRHYGKGGQLQYDGKWYYYYDAKGNLIQRSQNKWHDNKKSKEWHLGCWQYEWNANGSLKSVALPSGKAVYFEYDALGRRTAKIVLTDNKRTIHRYLWDGNVLLQEWHYDLKDRPKQVIDELGEISYDRGEPVENLITWLYEEGSFSPIGKIENGETYYIVNDYLGTPTQAFNTEGELIWRRELDIYGKVRYLEGEEEFIPFRYQGQYYDKETQLCYNRFRYYSPETGLYISQDPIELAGNNPNFYAYVFDSNAQVDVFGLDILEEAWKEVLKNTNNSSNLTVLGHFPRKNLGETFESYIEKAIRLKANYFNIGSMWDEVQKVTDPWFLNEKFLKLVTDRGDDILLNVSKNNIRPNSYLEKEIDFLLKNGYQWKNQWSLKKICK